MAREVSIKNKKQDRLQMTTRMVERALQAELTAHLGYDPHEKAETVRENSRNGTKAAGVLPIRRPATAPAPSSRSI